MVLTPRLGIESHARCKNAADWDSRWAARGLAEKSLCWQQAVRRVVARHPNETPYDFATVLFMCIFLFGFHRQSTVCVCVSLRKAVTVVT